MGFYRRWAPGDRRAWVVRSAGPVAAVNRKSAVAETRKASVRGSSEILVPALIVSGSAAPESSRLSCDADERPLGCAGG